MRCHCWFKSYLLGSPGLSALLSMAKKSSNCSDWTRKSYPVLTEASKYLTPWFDSNRFSSVINQNERQSVSVIWAIHVERFQCSLRISEISQGHNNPLHRTEINFSCFLQQNQPVSGDIFVQCLNCKQFKDLGFRRCKSVKLVTSQ